MSIRVAWPIGVALVFSASTAGADSVFPVANEVLFSPSNPNRIWLRTTYGILPSSDNGASWSYLCEDVLGLPRVSDAYAAPSIGMMGNGNVVAVAANGLDVSTDDGCDWSCQGGALAGLAFADIAVSPSDTRAAVALASTYGPDAGTPITQVFQTTDSGATWNPVGPPIDPTLQVQTIGVAKSDPTRIYVSATRGYGASRTAYLLVYTAQSGQWIEQPITQFDATMEEGIHLGAVDPNDADRVYLRSVGLVTGGEARLFVTDNASQADDAGATFVVPASASFQAPATTGGAVITGELLAFTLSQDGSKVYVGTHESGVWVAQASDLAFRQTNANIGVRCLATRPGSPDELWACSDTYSGGFIAGVSTDDGATFTSKLCTVTGLTGVLSCPSGSNGPLGCGATGNTASLCGPIFTDVCQLYSSTPTCTPCGEDAGESAEAGSPEAGAVPPKGVATARAACGCSTVGSPGGPAGAAGALVLVGAALGRRRRQT